MSNDTKWMGILLAVFLGMMTLAALFAYGLGAIADHYGTDGLMIVSVGLLSVIILTAALHDPFMDWLDSRRGL